MKCSRSGRTLFDSLAWKQAPSILKTVQLGHVSDPPGVQLYYKTKRLDRYGLTVYRCIRGTNSLEGGVHQNLIRKFGSFGAGPELANAMLTEYRLRHNIDVGTKNRNGHQYKGHYDPWLVQLIDHVRQKLHMNQNSSHLAIKVNAINYAGSNEVFGICPLPDDEMSRLGIEKRNTQSTNVDLTVPTRKEIVFRQIGSTTREKHHRYKYVSRYQNAKFAVIAIHTLEEIFQFIQMITQNCSSNKVPHFDQLAKEWNTKANGITIFYKTPEHIEKYYNHWKEQETAKNTKVIHETVIEAVEKNIIANRIPSAHAPALSPSLPVIKNTSAIVPVPPVTDTNPPPLPAINPSSLPPLNLGQPFNMSPNKNWPAHIYAPQSFIIAHHNNQNRSQSTTRMHLAPMPNTARAIKPIQRRAVNQRQNYVPINNSQKTIMPKQTSLPRPPNPHPIQSSSSFPNNNGTLFIARARTRSCNVCQQTSCPGKFDRSLCKNPSQLK